MRRPGNVICLWMLVTWLWVEFVNIPSWVAIIAAFAVGWYYNEQEVKRDA